MDAFIYNVLKASQNACFCEVTKSDTWLDGCCLEDCSKENFFNYLLLLKNRRCLCLNNTRSQTHFCWLNILLFMYIFNNQQLDFLCRYDWNQFYSDLLELKWCWKLLPYWFQCITAIAVGVSKFFWKPRYQTHVFCGQVLPSAKISFGFQIFLHTLWID